MASEFYVGVKIGAVMMGSFGAVLSGTRTTLNGLGRVADELRVKHTRLGETMARAVSHPMRNVAALRMQYERLGRTIEQVQARQLALTTRLARGAALREQRSAIGSEVIGTYATAVATAGPIIGAVRQSAHFEEKLRDIAITGDLSRKDEFALGETLRRAALATNQGHDAILEGVGTLVAAGMKPNEAGKYSDLLGRVATATNAEMNDLASMVYSVTETLGIKGEGAVKEAFNRAAYGGKLGRFELKDMAKALPTLTSAFAAKGVMGQEGLTQIIASLEVAREGAGSGEEAVTNMTNWLSHMNTPATIQAYKKANVDYEKSMSRLVSDGYSSYEASLGIAMKFIESRGDKFMKQWKAAGARGDPDAQRKLMESFGMGEVFGDIQTVNYLLAMRQGWDKYKQNKQEMGSKQALGTIDRDFEKRSQLATVAWRRMQIQIADLGITVGQTLLPSLTSFMDTLTPIIKGISEWAKANPKAIQGIAGLIGGIVGLKVAALAARWGINFFFLSTVNSAGTAFTLLSGKWNLMRALWVGGGSRLSTAFQIFGMGAGTAGKLAAAIGRAGSLLMGFGRGALAVGRALIPFGRGLVMTVVGPLKLFGQAMWWLTKGLGTQMLSFFGFLARGALMLGRVLGGQLVRSLMMAGRIMLWLGRAMLMNPIGLILTGIAVAGYLIYRNWDKIGPIFHKFVNAAKTRLLELWISLKGLPDRFMTIGRNIVDGLINGVRTKLSAAKDSIVQFGSSIKNWFADTLGIHSPSRVFMSLGDNIAQGAAIGIGRSSAIASRAAAGMALQAQAAASVNRIQAARAGGNGAAASAGGRAAGVTVHFSPTITIQNGDGSAKDQVMRGLDVSLNELEQLMDRVMARRARRSYGG